MHYLVVIAEHHGAPVAGAIVERLQGQDNARLDPAQVAPHSAQVQRLWHAMFGEGRP